MTGAVLRTVLGDVDAALMGVTLSHEHLLCDSSVWLQPPRDATGARMAAAEPAIDNLWWMRRFPNSNPSVLILDDEDLAAAELEPLVAAGGRTLVDLTPAGLGRDPLALARLALRTGLNVVAATGHYIAAAHPPSVAEATVDELAAGFVAEIEEGIDGTGVRAGVIGEIGMSDPLHPDEAKVLRAAALAQRETGAAISVHTAAHAIEVDSALRAAAIIEEMGGDLTRVVMGHLDTSLHRPDYHRAVADLGCVIEYDLFGHEFFESENGFQSFGDTERVRAVADRLEEGYGDRLLLSHDICYKIQLRRFGGYGYAHLLDGIAERLALVGVDGDRLAEVLTDNPRRVFALAAEPDAEGRRTR